MTFLPSSTNAGYYSFTRTGGGFSSEPDDGSAYVLINLFDSFGGYRTTGSHFGLYSVDLAEYSSVFPYPNTVQFVGYRPDGSTVTAEFTTDGLIDGTGPLADFQTFYFGPSFSDMIRFDVPSHGYALDNLVFFDVVPEPGTSVLVAVGGLLLLVGACGKRGLRAEPRTLERRRGLKSHGEPA